jgi:hypothetical protein
VLATPKNAGVYVDGFYAGVVDDFNGYFEGLPLPPGGHEVVLYLDGYRTTSRRIYLGPGSTFKLQETMERMPIGETSEAPILAPPLPPPPNGSSLPPRTASGAASSTASPAPPGHDVAILMLRVQPADAQVRIDGEPWASSDGGHFQIQLPAGRHRIEVTDSGYRGYSGDVDLVAGETVPLNVSLVRGGSD